MVSVPAYGVCQRDGGRGEGGDGPFGVIDLAGLVRLPWRDAPFHAGERALHGRGGRGGAAEIKPGDLAPVERDRPVVDVDDDVLGIGLADRPVELVARDQADLILGGVDLQAGGRLGEADELDLADDSGQAGRRRSRCRSTGSGAGRRRAGPAGPLPWASSLPSTAISVWSGLNRSVSRCQPADRASRWTASDGPSGDSTARLSSAQPSSTRRVAGPAGPRNVRSSVHCCPGGDLAGSSKPSSSRPETSGSARRCCKRGSDPRAAAALPRVRRRLDRRCRDLRFPLHGPPRRIDPVEAVREEPGLAGPLDHGLDARTARPGLGRLPGDAQGHRLVGHAAKHAGEPRGLSHRHLVERRDRGGHGRAALEAHHRARLEDQGLLRPRRTRTVNLSPEPA